MKVFKVVEEGKCLCCLWDGPLYVLADSLEEAKALLEHGDAGLCGECFADLLVSKRFEVEFGP